MPRITGISHEGQYTFLIIFYTVLRMRNVGDKTVEKVKTHILFPKIYIFFLNRAIYEIILKNIGELDRPRLTIWPMNIACWIPKATNTHSE